jgi:small-conductance mechanosensitive channel
MECILPCRNISPLFKYVGFSEQKVRDFLANPAGLASEYLWAIDGALRKYKIEIPFSQRDLHLRSSDLEYGITNNKIQPRNQ